MSKLFETFVATKAATLALTSRRAMAYPGAERALSSVGAWKKFVRTHSGVCTEATAKATVRLWNKHCGKDLPEHEVALTINNVKAKAKWKQTTSLSNVAKNWALVNKTQMLTKLIYTYTQKAKKQLKHLETCAKRVFKAMLRTSWITAFEVGREILSTKLVKLDQEQRIWLAKITKANTAIDRLLAREAN